MTPEQQKALLGIALLAAFSDGNKADAEREEIRRIAESLSTEAGAPKKLRSKSLISPVSRSAWQRWISSSAR